MLDIGDYIQERKMRGTWGGGGGGGGGEWVCRV